MLIITINYLYNLRHSPCVPSIPPKLKSYSSKAAAYKNKQTNQKQQPNKEPQPLSKNISLTLEIKYLLIRDANTEIEMNSLV